MMRESSFQDNQKSGFVVTFTNFDEEPLSPEFAVKQRFVQSGMKWHIHKADMLITVRDLKLTSGRMEQFWKKYMRWAA